MEPMPEMVVDGQVTKHHEPTESSRHAEGGREIATVTANDWREALRTDLLESPLRGRLSMALMAMAFIHLACFLGCHAIFDPRVHRDMRHLALWLVELMTVLGMLSVVMGPGWFRSSSSISLLAKLWTTFLILSFNVVTLNAVTGFELSWYKPVWGTLSTFLFASLAWVFTPWLLVPAVQMWLTGLLMVRFPEQAYLIYGVSWWVALTGIAALLRRPDAGVIRGRLRTR
jgi:hypothetical protein